MSAARVCLLMFDLNSIFLSLHIMIKLCLVSPRSSSRGGEEGDGGRRSVGGGRRRAGRSRPLGGGQRG